MSLVVKCTPPHTHILPFVKSGCILRSIPGASRCPCAVEGTRGQKSREWGVLAGVVAAGGSRNVRSSCRRLGGQRGGVGILCSVAVSTDVLLVTPPASAGQSCPSQLPPAHKP